MDGVAFIRDGLILDLASCIIVDSTRRGKSMPDALAKTIPIWCTVINRLIFADNVSVHGLHVPRDIVGASECSQIEAKLDCFVDDAKVFQLSHIYLI